MASTRSNGRLQVRGGEQRSALSRARGACCGRCSRGRGATPHDAPSASRSAAISIAIAGPNGAQASSSARVHCTRTGRPAAARASSAASKRHVVGAVVAVAAGALDVLDDDPVGGQAEREREIARAGCRCPGCGVQTCSASPCQCASAQDGADRGVREIGAGVAGAQGARRRRTACGGALLDHLRLDRLRLQPVGERRRVGQRLALRPGRAGAKPLERLDARPPRARRRRRRSCRRAPPRRRPASARAVGVVERQQHRAGRGRSQHAAVQHRRQLEVVDEARPRRTTLSGRSSRGTARADDAVARRLRRHAGGRFAVEQRVVGERPVARVRAAARRRSSPSITWQTVRAARRAARAAASDRWRAPRRRHSAARCRSPGSTGCPR